jgi:hypothetical protein
MNASESVAATAIAWRGILPPWLIQLFASTSLLPGTVILSEAKDLGIERDVAVGDASLRSG